MVNNKVTNNIGYSDHSTNYSVTYTCINLEFFVHKYKV